MLSKKCSFAVCRSDWLLCFVRATTSSDVGLSHLPLLWNLSLSSSLSLFLSLFLFLSRTYWTQTHRYSLSPRAGASPGLVVTGRDSCTEGCRFESKHISSHIFVVKIVMFVWKTFSFSLVSNTLLITYKQFFHGPL